MKLQTARGVSDYAPEDKILRQAVMDKIRSIFELYGFPPMETPMIERTEVLAAKYAGGAEILKEMFTLKDQGKRDLCLRYDLTVPLCRYVGMNPTLKMPFKRYQIGRVFRDGPIKAGRVREFWQCDADVVGVASMLADAQLLQIAQRFFKDMGMKVVIEVNNRKLLDGIMESLGIPTKEHESIILAIDKLKKIGLKGVETELKQKNLLNNKTDKLLKVLNTSGTNLQKLEKLRKVVTSSIGKQGIDEIEEVLKYNKTKNVVFAPALARGLAYYTGTVYEVFLQNTTLFSGSLAAGGRYDNMIGAFLGGNRQFPAVGISFGIEPILTVMKATSKIEVKKSKTTAFVIPIDTLSKSMKLAEDLRKEGINTDVDLLGRGVSKNLDYCNKLGIPYALILGKKEVKAKKITLRDMNTGKEKTVTLAQAVKMLP